MDKLSPELLLLLASHLESTALLHFSLTNKQVRATLISELSRSIKLAFGSHEELKHIIQKLQTSFISLKHIRDLSICPSQPCRPTSGRDHLQDSGEEPLDPWKYAMRHRSKEVVAETQWECLQSLIDNLALRNLYWAREEQIPMSIFRQLKCRLHMLNFSLRSLDFSRDMNTKVSADDLEIIRANKIETVVIDEGNRTIDAIDQLLPSLRHIALKWQTMRCGNGARARNARPPPTFPSGPPLAIGKVESMVFYGSRGYRTLQSWQPLTDFAHLRVLKLYNTWLTAEQFGWLRACSLQLDEFGAQYHPRAEGAEEAATEYLLSLPPLRTLLLYNHYTSLPLIVQHCGHRLRSLHSTRNNADMALISTLQEHCPYIEDLGMDFTRAGGSVEEVTLYRMLGTLRIRTLNLAMVSKFINRDNYGKPSIDDMHSALKDVAFDETLAKSIFGMISAGKNTLQTLTVGIKSLYDPYPPPAQGIFAFIHLIARSYRLSASGGLTIMQVNDERGHFRRHCEKDETFADLLQGPEGDALRELWPACRDGRIQDVWHSFPLTVGFNKTYV